MDKTVEFSNPVAVDEGVAFRVRMADGSKRVVVATRARLGVSEEAQGLALLGAFIKASPALCAEAKQRAGSETASPVYLDPR